MKADGWGDFIGRWIARGVPAWWQRVRQWVRDFTPGAVYCVICGMLVALFSITWVQLSWQKQLGALNQAVDDAGRLSQVQAAALRDLRGAGWRQSSAAMALPAPAQIMVTAALASLALIAREEEPVVSIDAWAGLHWLNQAAKGHGLAVDHLQRIDRSPSEAWTGDEPSSGLPLTPDEPAGTWSSFDVRLAGTRQALAGFFNTLAATAGAVRALQFTISAEAVGDAASAQADLRLQINPLLSLPELPELFMPGPVMPESVMSVTAGQQPVPIPGKAALWRDGYMIAWHRLPDGEVVRTASEATPRDTKNEFMPALRDNKAPTGDATNQ